MVKQKKKEVLRFSIEDKSLEEAADRVDEVIKSLSEYGFEKVDIKISIKTLQSIGPLD